MNTVAVAVEAEHGNLVQLGVYDPVFRNPGGRILSAFDLQAALAVLRAFAQDFHGQIDAVRLLARVDDSTRPKEHNIGLAKFALPETYRQGSKQNFAKSLGCDESLQQAEEVIDDT